MSEDRLRRAHQRSLGVDPGEPEEWLASAMAARRRGDTPQALACALAGLQHHPRDPGLQESLQALGYQGAWPSADGGPHRRRASPLSGPIRGVQRWRLALPGRPHGAALVGRSGRAWLRCEPQGLVRVTSEGRLTRVHPHWPVDLPPLIVNDTPRCFDPLLEQPGTAPGVELLRAPGALIALTRSHLRVLSSGGLPRWQVQALSRASARSLTLEGDCLALATHSVEGNGERESEAIWYRLSSGERLGSLRFGFDPLRSLAIPNEGWVLSSPSCVARVTARGEVLWSKPFVGATEPALHDGALVLSAQSGLCALNVLDGRERWRARGLVAEHPPIVDARGVTYVVSAGDVVALSPSGERLLRVNLGSFGPLGPPTIAAPGVLYVCAGSSLISLT